MKTATKAAELLRGAETGAKLDALPEGLAPTTEAEAYAIQDAVLGDAEVAAWKLAAIKPVAELQASPIPRDMIYDALPAHILTPEIEVEIAIRIDADLPPRASDYARTEVLAALGPAHAAFEVICSRFADRKGAAKLSALADRASGAGIAIGSGIADWQSLDFTALDVSLEGRGMNVHTAGFATVAQTVDALVWLANHASRRGMGLRAGQFVITGARIGPLAVPPGQVLTARIERIGDVMLSI